MQQKELWQKLLTSPLALQLRCYKKKSFLNAICAMEKTIFREQQHKNVVLFKTDYLE